MTHTPPAAKKKFLFAPPNRPCDICHKTIERDDVSRYRARGYPGGWKQTHRVCERAENERFTAAFCRAFGIPVPKKRRARNA